MKAAAGYISLKRKLLRNKTRFRPTAPSYQGERPNLCGRAFESSKMPSRSLLHAVSFPVCTGLFPVFCVYSRLRNPFSCIFSSLFLHFFLLFHPCFEYISYICTVFRKRHDFICSNSHSNHHLGKEQRAMNQIWFGVRTKSASSPYRFEVCGEPEWDMAGAHFFHIHELVLTC